MIEERTNLEDGSISILLGEREPGRHALVNQAFREATNALRSAR
jgi:hypothetical protein